MSTDSVGASGSRTVDGTSYRIFRAGAVEGSARLPFSLKVLLEKQLRDLAGR